MRGVQCSVVPSAASRFPLQAASWKFRSRVPFEENFDAEKVPQLIDTGYTYIKTYDAHDESEAERLLRRRPRARVACDGDVERPTPKEWVGSMRQACGFVRARRSWETTEGQEERERRWDQWCGRFGEEPRGKGERARIRAR